MASSGRIDFEGLNGVEGLGPGFRVLKVKGLSFGLWGLTAWVLGFGGLGLRGQELDVRA